MQIKLQKVYVKPVNARKGFIGFINQWNEWFYKRFILVLHSSKKILLEKNLHNKLKSFDKRNKFCKISQKKEAMVGM